MEDEQQGPALLLAQPPSLAVLVEQLEVFDQVADVWFGACVHYRIEVLVRRVTISVAASRDCWPGDEA
ncbi:MAG: hypothetical protein ACKVWR_07145 [Acidimicrobiales bacterium]